jgi:hypothetical protein
VRLISWTLQSGSEQYVYNVHALFHRAESNIVSAKKCAVAETKADFWQLVDIFQISHCTVYILQQYPVTSGLFSKNTCNLNWCLTLKNMDKKICGAFKSIQNRAASDIFKYLKFRKFFLHRRFFCGHCTLYSSPFKQCCKLESIHISPQ